jgi:uncharacterized repeat protein (TIGR01451 family)
MKRTASAALVAAVGLVAFVAGAAAQAAPGFTELDSVSSAGVQGDRDSELPAVSADGRFVAFVSLSDNLVPGDTNGAADIFVRDRLTGTTERVNVSSSGAQANGDSGLLNGMGGPSISADGRHVAFDSQATNLVKGDTNGAIDVFVRDRGAGTTERVSVASDGTQGNGDSTHPSISADGSRVAFGSFATNLVQPDTNLASDVFVHDRSAGTTVRVSDAPNGSQGNNWSFSPKLDGNGHLVAFDSFASNLGGNPNSTVQVFLRDLDSGTLEAVSSLPGSTDFLEQGELGQISPDGRFVVFDYRSSTVSPRAIVLLDRTTGTREIESVSDAGAAGNDDSFDPVVSSDGRFVSFDSIASNLVSDDTNGRSDVFVRDRQAGTTRRVSVGSNGQQGDLDSASPAIDDDGQVIGFQSAASTFVTEGTQSPPFANDIFVRDARPPADLALTLTDAPDPATFHGTLTYTATIANAGPTNATGVTLVANLPSGANFLSASGSCTRAGKGKSDGTLTCNVSPLVTGASTTVTIVVQPTNVGTISLTAKVYADQSDPNQANNSATETTTIVR